MTEVKCSLKLLTMFKSEQNNMFRVGVCHVLWIMWYFELTSLKLMRFYW